MKLCCGRWLLWEGGEEVGQLFSSSASWLTIWSFFCMCPAICCPCRRLDQWGSNLRLGSSEMLSQRKPAASPRSCSQGTKGRQMLQLFKKIRELGDPF